MKTQNLHLIMAAALSAGLLGGCGNMPNMDLDLSALHMGGLFQSDVEKAAAARYANMTGEQAVNQAEASFNKGVEERLAFYAPEHFDDAQDALQDARKLLAKKAQDSDIFKAAYLTEKNVEDGIQAKAAVKQYLAEPLRYQEALERRAAAEAYPKEYKNLMDDLGDLIRTVEAGKADKVAKDLPELVAGLRALEIKVIKYNALNPGETLLAKAEKLDGDKIAASLYLEATAAHQQADGFIQLNPYEEAKVNELAAAFTFAAKHLLHVTEETVALQEVDKKSLVTVILQQEEQLQRIGKGLGSADVRDQPLGNQAAALATRAMELAAKAEEAKRLSGELEQANKTQADLKGQLGSSETELGSAKARIAELEQQLGAQQAQGSSANARITELEQQLQTQTAEAQAAQARIGELELQLKNQQADAQGDKLASQAKARQTEQQLAAKTAEAKKLQATIDSLNASLDAEKEKSRTLAQELAAASTVEAPAAAAEPAAAVQPN